MDLTRLLSLIAEIPIYRQLRDELQQNASTRAIILDAAKPYLIAALYQSLPLPMMVVTAQPEKSRRLYEQLTVWSNSSQIKLLPEPDALPYQHIASDASTDQERVKVLSALANINGETGAPLVVASAPAIMTKTTPYRDFTSACHSLKPGMDIEPFQLLERWQGMGYKMESMAEMPGTMSHRGGIVDIYPTTSDLPARLEFLGNTIESIRAFDPASQRSLAPLSFIAIGPATEQLTSGEDSVLSFLPPTCLLVLDEPQSIEQLMDELDTQASALRAEKVGRKRTTS